MKKLVIALALAAFTTAGFAQTAPTSKKQEASKTQVAKNSNDTKHPAKAASNNSPKKHSHKKKHGK